MSAETLQNSAGVVAVVGLKKGEVIKAFALKQGDVGSPEVQVALLTKRIQNLTSHFETHREDKHSKRGMMALINRRKALLRYLKEENPERYRTLIASLGLRK